eukprot:TRINITY_DN377_c0_g3_i1.p1 TRINITY_DN377_c0_g3~~TRINITY_DN377_c0_g3_i1.p1  ORF type:complete len:555 (+),score=157.98 TRINITY_DN377_c0_g3_i1:1690-3354(+)
MNLNEDPLLTGQIKYVLKKGKNTIGKYDRDSVPDVTIGGVGATKNHCTIILKGSTVKLIPNKDFNAAKVYVNGKLVTESTIVEHNDCILFGSHNFFMLKDPSKPEDASIDWEYANKEVFKDQVKALTSNQEKKLQAKLKEMEEKYEIERRQIEESARLKVEQEMKRAEERYFEYKRKVKELQERGGDGIELKKLEEEMKKMRVERKEGMKMVEEEINKEAERELQRQSKAREHAQLKLQEQKELEEELAFIIPKVNEVNEICMQLGRLDYLYVPSIITDVKGNQVKSRICVKIYPDHEQELYNQVELSEFTDKYYLIQEKFQNYQYDLEHNGESREEESTEDEVKIFGIDIKNDWIPIGLAHIYTDSLANLLSSNNEQTPLLNNKGKTVGELAYSLIPKYLDGNTETNLLLYDSIEQFKGRTLKVTFKLHCARGLPSKLANDLMCRYRWIDEEADEYETEATGHHTINPEFKYEKEHELFVDPYVLEHIWDSALIIGVYGKMSQEDIDQIVQRRARQTTSSTQLKLPLSNITNTSNSAEQLDDDAERLKREILE